MDPLQWMGAVRMRVQTANKNMDIMKYHGETGGNCNIFYIFLHNSQTTWNTLVIFWYKKQIEVL